MSWGIFLSCGLSYFEPEKFSCSPEDAAVVSKVVGQQHVVSSQCRYSVEPVEFGSFYLGVTLHKGHVDLSPFTVCISNKLFEYRKECIVFFYCWTCQTCLGLGLVLDSFVSVTFQLKIFLLVVVFKFSYLLFDIFSQFLESDDACLNFILRGRH